MLDCAGSDFEPGDPSRAFGRLKLHPQNNEIPNPAAALPTDIGYFLIPRSQ